MGAFALGRPGVPTHAKHCFVYFFFLLKILGLLTTPAHGRVGALSDLRKKKKGCSSYFIVSTTAPPAAPASIPRPDCTSGS